MELFVEKIVSEGSDDAPDGNSMVFEKVSVLVGNSGVNDMLRQIFELDEGTIFFAEDFIKLFSVAIVNNGG